MASEDEFRRVAEEIRALARSLARDFRDAVDQSRAGGSAAGEAVRHGLKGVADEARRGVHDTFAGFQPGSRSRRPRPRYWVNDLRPRDWRPPSPPADDPAHGPAAGGWPPWAGFTPCGPWQKRGPGRHGRPQSEDFRPTPRGQQHRGPGRRRGLPPVRHRWDSTTIIGALAVVFGVAWLLDAVSAAHISVEGAVAVGLMLLGAAMIVTGRTDWSLSRRAWPVFAGGALILVLIATSSTFGAGSGSAMSFGNRTVPIVQPGETIQGGFGNLDVNASTLVAGQSITVKNIAGNIRITPPPGLPVEVHAKVLAGEICVNGRNVGSGVDASANVPIAGASPGPPVVINAHEASGQVIVGARGCNR